MMKRPVAFPKRLWFSLDRHERANYRPGEGFLVYRGGHTNDSRAERRKHERRVAQVLWLLNNGGLLHFAKSTGATLIVDRSVLQKEKS